jgi:AAA domain, putative AbiEii toxin, Type IV TA system
MKIELSLNNFRCFASVGPVSVAPITLLIGENSTGKTSFMAALRIAVEAFSRPSPNPFNREPYFLGSFEQIAHYRGGRSGRARTFSLKIEIPRDEQGDLFSGRERLTPSASHEMVFEKGRSQPEIVAYHATVGDWAASFDFSSSKPNITIRHDGEPDIQIDPERSPRSLALRRDIGFLSYYLEDVIQRSRSELLTAKPDQNESTSKALSSALRNSARHMGRSVFASAPVRVQPRRVYIPSELTDTNAGEQVPLEMANQKLAAPQRWQNIRERLNAFGNRSGLFEDIDVKRLGKNDSDPFHIQIKNRGPASNILDVGYGVSQALPLLYPIYSDNYDFYLLQQPEVHLHPRAQAEFGSMICSMIAERKKNNYIIETHSDFIVDRIRTEVRAGRMPAQDIAILLFRRKGLETEILQLGVNDKGDVTGFPDDYRDFFLQEQARVLGL